MTPEIKAAIPLIPHKPGVYLMKDKDDKVIYVGKAKDLYKRVSQYFLRPQVGKVAKMALTAHHFETIITKTEKEAFLLEENLIHTYYPRFNILLKDGKHYPYIALKKKGDPFLKIARDEKNKDYFYFGPFPTSTYAYEVINLLNKLFPTRKCKNIPSTPCLYYHMGQCLGPCINKIDDKVYEDLFNQIKSFLEGHNEDIKKKLKDEMMMHAEKEEYEKANEIKNTLKAIDHVLAKQGVENKDHVSRDVFAYTKRDSYLSLAVLTYRRGILLGKEAFIVEEFGDEEEQILDLILQYYRSHSLPKEILINIPSIKDSIEEIYEVKVNSVTKGNLVELIEMANLNAKQELDSHFMSARLSDDNLSLLEDLGHRLNISTPLRIELFDNSHIQGDSPVGVVVVFVNGEPLKKLYRKFNIEGDEKRDDYSSMKEVMKRRYLRLKENNEAYPDLILTDGGLGQVHAGIEALKDIDVDIPIYGLFKNDKHQTEGLIDKDGKVHPLDDNKALFFLLIRMQDEVHRFAITFHHQKRSKNYKIGVLDDIKGLGEKRKSIILQNYPTIDALKRVNIQELSQFVPLEVAQRIVEKLKDIE
ncbi:MAG: excinuclease ABC subunit UvrC [Bacilli bacterium]|nr:excinuclease ABC subunit UvrC [Bacilli bacterium]